MLFEAMSWHHSQFTFSYVCSIQMAKYAFVITCFLPAFRYLTCASFVNFVDASHSFLLSAMSNSVLFALFISVCSNSSTIL